MTPHLCSFYAETKRKSMKCDDFNDFELDLEMAFKVIRKL